VFRNRRQLEHRIDRDALRIANAVQVDQEAPVKAVRARNRLSEWAGMHGEARSERRRLPQYGRARAGACRHNGNDTRNRSKGEMVTRTHFPSLLTIRARKFVGKRHFTSNRDSWTSRKPNHLTVVVPFLTPCSGGTQRQNLTQTK
jgi:hypothetical protein